MTRWSVFKPLAIRNPDSLFGGGAEDSQTWNHSHWAVFATLLLCLSFAILGISPANAQDGKVLKLGDLRAQYDSKKAQIFSASEEFNTRYALQLEELQTTAQAAGDLELVLAAREEAKAFRDRGDAKLEPSKHAALARLQKIYTERYPKIVAEQNAKMAPVAAAYRAHLDSLIKELTKEGSLVLAVEAQKELTLVDQFIAASAATTPLGPVTGRYVRVELSKTEVLSLAEVEVFSGGKNIAPKGKATQSSTHDHSVQPTADKAIDGDTNGDFMAGSTTHTHSDINPWWEVDLQKDKELSKIVIWNRTDSNQARLDGFKLSILDANRKTVWQTVVPKAPEKSMVIELGPSK